MAADYVPAMQAEHFYWMLEFWHDLGEDLSPGQLAERSRRYMDLSSRRPLSDRCICCLESRVYCDAHLDVKGERCCPICNHLD